MKGNWGSRFTASENLMVLILLFVSATNWGEKSERAWAMGEEGVPCVWE